MPNARSTDQASAILTSDNREPAGRQPAVSGPTYDHPVSDDTPTIEIPDDLLDLHRRWAQADSAVHARIAEIEAHEAEHGRAPLPTTMDEPGRAEEQLPALRQARSDAAAAVRERVAEVAGTPDRRWAVQAALLTAAADPATV